jgi:predicted DNA-binding helix-hairpin-helix protein
MDERLAGKLRILADAAKYDASCASSGAPKRSGGRTGLGSTSNGICHAYTPDGRCVSLLKILLTNYCQFDCAYCINLKTIPEASPELIAEAGRWADRLSINIELPTERSLQAFAPEKNAQSIRSAMGHMHQSIQIAREAKSAFAPAGQSTQVIVGADATTDVAMLDTSDTLYRRYALRRVYYSAFSPIPDASSALPPRPPPLRREHRLYQADWLLRHYGFSVGDIASATLDGMLDLEVDPKLAWALRNRHLFPADVNRADRELLLRVPGLGARAVDRIVLARQHTKLRFADIARLTTGLKRARPFLVTPDHRPVRLTDRADLRQRLIRSSPQADLFAWQPATSH